MKEQETKYLGEQMDALEDAIREDLIEAGISSINIDGAKVYINRQIWASPDGEGAFEAMKGVEGFDILVKPSVNTQSLSAVVRELPKDKDGMPILPAELVGKIKVREVFDLRGPKS
jgi:hypothetical protein